MRQFVFLGSALACALAACTPVQVGEKVDAGTDVGDAGVGDAGEQDAGGEDAGPPAKAPADTKFSVGVTDNSGGSPNGASIVMLQFRDGTPSEDTVVAKRVAAAPVIDGDGADWASIPGSTLALGPRGESIGMGKEEWDAEYLLAYNRTVLYDFGITELTTKAAYDDENIYFLLQWEDATEDRLRDQWEFDGTVFKKSSKSEDRAYFSFNVSFPDHDAAGCAAACHVKERLGEVTTEAKAYRFRMHTNDAGEIADVWMWGATRTNPVGLADDGYWAVDKRYDDAPTAPFVANTVTPEGGSAQPQWMAADGVNANVDYVYAEPAGTPLAIPFDATGAAAGARIPGYRHQVADELRRDVRAKGVWKDGRWTVEFARKLVNADPNDAQFPLE